MVLIGLPTYPAMNFLIESPLVYFLVCAPIKITFLVEIPSWPGRRELPIAVSTTTNAPTTASSCYIKDNMYWNGADAYNELLLGGSMVDCQTLCRDQGIQNFVWRVLLGYFDHPPTYS